MCFSFHLSSHFSIRNQYQSSDQIIFFTWLGHFHHILAIISICFYSTSKGSWLYDIRLSNIIREILPRQMPKYGLARRWWRLALLCSTIFTNTDEWTKYGFDKFIALCFPLIQTWSLSSRISYSPSSLSVLELHDCSNLPHS